MSVEQRVETRLQILERRVRRRRSAAAGTPATTADVRTCTHCGTRTAFLHDPRGGWASCAACGRYA